MKKIVALLFGLSMSISVYSQTAEEWFLKGEEAYQEEKYDIAMDYYKKAADLGSVEACGVLSFMYYNGAASTKKNGKVIQRDTDMALLWAKRAGVNNNLDADIVLALISYFKGDFSKTIQILSGWKEALYSEAKIALAISYMMNGNESIRFLGKLKAEPLLKEVYNKLRNDKPNYFYAVCTILAKIEFEKKWRRTDKVDDYLSEFGEIGTDDFEYCPLAYYVVGRAQYHNTSIEKTYLETAAKYEYTGSKYEVLYPFADEIKQEYNKIK